MFYKRTFTVLALLAAIAFVPCAAKAENDLQALEGYRQEELLPGFVELLQRDPEVYGYFKRTPRAFTVVRGDKALQQKLVAKTIKPQAVLVEAAPIDVKAERDLKQFLDADHSKPNLVDDHIEITIDPETDTTTVTRVISSTSPMPEVTPTASIPASAVDINAVPDAADTAADAMGWPKYLKAPAGCPKVRSDIEYIHEATTFRRQDVTAPLVRNFIGHGQVMLTDNQVMAFPVISPNSTKNSSFQLTQAHDGAFGGQGTQYRVAYAYCPGDLTGFTPEGETPLAAGCVDTQAGSHNAIVVAKNDTARSTGALAAKGCFLEPNKRYFVNIAPKDGDSCTTAVNRILNMERATDRAKEHARSFMRNVKGKDVALCSQLFTGGISSEPRAPYAGPCLTKAPYPINYDTYSCGLTRQQPECGGAYSSGMNVTCHDPEGKVASSEYVQSCAANTLTWVKGFKKPAYSSYLCETLPPTDANYAKVAVCAAHNEGKVRHRVCRRADSQAAIDGKGGSEKCQKVDGRYAWITTRGDGYNGTPGVESCTYEGPLE